VNADDAVLELLRSVPDLDVHDGAVDVDETQKIISVPLPYVMFWSTPGYDNDIRHSGRAASRVTEFQLTGVGEDRAQAKAVLDRARAAISRKRIGSSLIRRSNDNQIVRRDDDYTRPGGGPIFVGVDRYSVAVSTPPKTSPLPDNPN
jgi:hypothetical protein